MKGASPQEKKEAIKRQVSSEIAMANAQDLITKSTEKCYFKCVPSPSTSLSSKEEVCLDRCLQRYFEAFNIVASAYTRRVAAERNAGATLQ
ncbi:hypothetical protein BCV69DRAFT_282503 [Microstroma glucosiphilum]|uniref:Mitochondrial import inner membrane translocase subunit n=1 Tax=Pseudomicrostroma glucosiphilum TaxID=1684307 RepID=A0A316U6Z5_9BASI|nr:hypothetical protein BCV69DRAFT_282503 [Pseudomicrostroma glucosiphilum]PWN21000.1 hypothetical protein BCV69DRAFT_282503 [Pseudomicrostroma glucosiphilum]